MQWRNRETFEMFREYVHDFGLYSNSTETDLLKETITECQQKAGANFLESIAQHLHDDQWPYSGWNLSRIENRLTGWAYHALLKRVDWRQVAERLVEHEQKGPWPAHTVPRCWCQRPFRVWFVANTPLMVKADLAG
jgi:hypothetical protein